jgi:hypothetical protein
MKTDIDIKDDIYKHIKGSVLEKTVSGKLSKTLRPAASKTEDIVISILSNENGQLQSAYVNVNIYVPSLLRKYAKESQYEENTVRLRELCQISQQLLEVGRGKDFRFTLESQRVMAVNNNEEYVINNRLLYRQSNE